MLDKIKSALFYTEEEEEFVLPTSPATHQSPTGFVKPTGPAVPSVITYGVRPESDASLVNSGTMKDQIAAELAKAIEGQAYGKFKQMSTSLKARIPDASQRTIATGATLEIQGVKSLDILTAARSALAFLDGEANSFETEATSDAQTTDAQVEQLKATTATTVADKEAQIKKLQDEITQLHQDQLQAESEAIKTKGAIEVSRAQFRSAMSQVKAELEQDIKDVTLYLGGA
jgi:hypothetical protein